MIGVRVPTELTDAIDEWRAEQRPIPTRPEAIRRLVELELASKGGKAKSSERWRPCGCLRPPIGPLLEDVMPDKRAPEYKEADRRTGADEVSRVRARGGVTGHNVRYVLAFGLLAVIVGFVIVYVAFVHR